MHVSSTSAFTIKEKLKKLKERLKVWNKGVFRILDLNIDNIIIDLNEMEVVAANEGN